MKTPPLPLTFVLAGSLLVLFVMLPLAGAIFATTPQALGETLFDAEVSRSIGLTFLAAAIATALTLLTGLPLAYLLARYSFPAKRLVEGIVDLPVIIPHTAAGVALLMVFGSRGLLGQFLAPLGLYFTDHLGGIVVAMMFVSLPYLVNMSREAFAAVDAEMEKVALIDGASPWQAFWHVTLPQARRGVLGSALMMWARGISEFGAVVILAYHPKIVPVLIYERFEGFGLKAALPVAVILILVVLVIFSLLRLALMPEHTRA
jgi:molybdate/tungstate transport system permease protein